MPNTLYLAECKEWGETIKIGITTNPERRKFDYYTYVKTPVSYKALFILITPLTIPLEDLDHFEFPDWMKEKKRFGEYYEGGAGTEFWNLVNPIETIQQFLTELGIGYTLSEVDPYTTRPVRIRTSTPIRPAAPAVSLEITLKQRFQDLVLQGKPFRSIQEELWNRFETLVQEPPLRGIVQWPTGVGKTIGILILFVLSYDAHKKRTPRTPFRGLFISPTNDIISTLKLHIDKLSAFGLKLLYGNEGRLTDLIKAYPDTEDTILITTHASLIDCFECLPIMTHIHYDEVHHIAGEKLFEAINKMKETIPILSGTSATPLTSTATQHEKFHELFGKPTIIISCCDVNTAVENKWIAKPQFIPSAHNPLTSIELFETLYKQIELLRSSWTGGKVILYVPTLSKLAYVYVKAIEYLKEKNITNWNLYVATPTESFDEKEEDEKEEETNNEAKNTYRTLLSTAKSDETFKTTSKPGIHLLIACKRYREGADIQGIDMTAVWMGQNISAYILIQIIGRAMRYDPTNPEKVGRCMIFRGARSTEDSLDTIFDNIMLDMIDFLKTTDVKPDKTSIRAMVEQYFGGAYIGTRSLSIEETVHRLQLLYKRIYIRENKPITYKDVRENNRILKFQSREDYMTHTEKNNFFYPDPISAFRDDWISWSDFLCIDTSKYPSTKIEWIILCTARNILTWEAYQSSTYEDLPKNPVEVYPDYTNWDAEFKKEETLVF
jgi:superfamily II DNA or RNA helicase